MKPNHMLLIAALACFGIAMGADAASTTVLGADANLWDSAGLAAIVLHWLWPVAAVA